MITDIFSSFDPRDFPAALSIQIPSSYPWLISLLLIPMILSHFWVSPTRHLILLFPPISLIIGLISKAPSSRIAGAPHLITSLFIILTYFNLIGLSPYVFGLSAHLVIALSLSLPLWISFIISAITYAPKSWLASFVPTGAPTPLIPFLILIEIVRVVVRFITLAVRLMANIVAGHVILGILGVYIASALLTFSLSALLPIIIGHLVYITFEFGVALIQAYIFSILLSLYSGEHPRYPDRLITKA